MTDNLYVYGEEEDEFGGLFGDVGHFFSNAAKVAGKEIGRAGSTIQGVGGKIGGAIKKIPVVGAPVHTLLGASYRGVTAPIDFAIDVGIKGKRIDKAFLSQVATAVKDVKGSAPYAQTALALVPGIGTGAAAALAAGTALASGQPIDKALISGVIAAIPGGTVAKSAATIAASGLDSAMHGKKFDTAGSLLAALPIPEEARKALATGIQMTAEMAKGKPINQAVADAALQKGLSALPPDAKKAFQVGLAMQTGAELQNVRGGALPTISNKLAESGLQLAKTMPAVGEARKLVGAGTKGFDLGHGLLSQNAKLFDIVSLRKGLSRPDDKKGFDMALASRIGLVTHPTQPKLSPAAQAGKAITVGMQGMPHPKQKQSIMRSIQANPSAGVGAKVALTQVSKERSSWPVRVIKAIKAAFKA